MATKLDPSEPATFKELQPKIIRDPIHIAPHLLDKNPFQTAKEKNYYAR